MRKVTRILRKSIWLGLLAISLLGIWFAFNSPLFRIYTILCTYNDRPCPVEIETELSGLKDSSILTFRPQKVEKKIRKADISISSITINPQLPHTLTVTITSRISSITMGSSNTSAQLIIDHNYVPFEIEATPSSLPKITSSHAVNIALGQPLSDPLLKSAMALSKTLNDYFIIFDTIQAEDYHLTVVLKNGIRAIFPMDGNFRDQVTSLQLILRESTIQPPLQEVDLRFAKPVIR